MPMLLFLTFLLVGVGPALIVGTLTLIAAHDCPELVRRRPARTRVRGPVIDWAVA